MSDKWVKQRIVPSERQNLGLILKENKLNEYNEFKMLLLGKGRCAQDDCMIAPINEGSLPRWLKERMDKWIVTAVKLNDSAVVLIYRDDSIWFFDLKNDIKALPEGVQGQLSDLNELLSSSITVGNGGAELLIGRRTLLLANELYGQGKLMPFDKTLLHVFLKEYLVDTGDICNKLDCSRQYVNQLVNRGDLRVLKDCGNSRIYALSDIAYMIE